jgi:hypothetical protein
VEVVGLPADDLAAIRDRSFAADDWTAILRVTVDAGPEVRDLPPVARSYAISSGAIRFVPDWPLDPRVAHRVVFDPTRLPKHRDSAAESWRSRPIELPIAATAPQVAPTTRVVQVFPNDVLLENQLRIYIHFSAPMGTRSANDHVHLLDDQDREVDDAFLPLDVSLWNADRTRFTLLFDPGRVKRGILPNREKGRPLVSGRRYALVVDREWRDAQDRPLVEAFRREFHVVPAVLAPIIPTEWHLDVPMAGSHDALNVTFPRALDHAIVEKALFVTLVTSATGTEGHPVDGSIAVDDATIRWTFTPRHAWAPGEYRLGAISVLEDPAGNRVGRAFDFDPRHPGNTAEDSGDSHGQASIPFVVSPRGPSQRGRP